MSKQQVRYWAAQVRALVGEDIGVTERYNERDVLVTLPDERNTKEQRAGMIAMLGRAGIKTLSTTDEDHIRVDVQADPLEHPYDDVPYENS